MLILIVNKISLLVACSYEADAPDQNRFAGPWSDVNQYAHIPCGDFDPDIVDAVNNNGVIELQINQNKLAQKRELKLNKLRELRAIRLNRVDELVNIAVLDSWSAQDKAELKSYRNALLNITEEYKEDMSLIDDLDLDGLEWPEEPSES